jgi:hypothetical protein
VKIDHGRKDQSASLKTYLSSPPMLYSTIDKLPPNKEKNTHV